MLNATADIKAVRKAWKFLNLCFHPDKAYRNKMLKVVAEVAVKEINQAYDDAIANFEAKEQAEKREHARQAEQKASADRARRRAQAQQAQRQRQEEQRQRQEAEAQRQREAQRAAEERARKLAEEVERKEREALAKEGAAERSERKGIYESRKALFQRNAKFELPESRKERHALYR